jgi:hypothetical protein
MNLESLLSSALLILSAQNKRYLMFVSLTTKSKKVIYRPLCQIHRLFFSKKELDRASTKVEVSVYAN